jgi:hypothetical protein
MKTSTILRAATAVSLAVFLTTASAWSSEEIPQQPDVRRFVDNADTCTHLSGEISGENTAEQKKLIKQINKVCSLAKKQLKSLDRKYKNDSKVQETLNQYREDLAD